MADDDVTDHQVQQQTTDRDNSTNLNMTTVTTTTTTTPPPPPPPPQHAREANVFSNRRERRLLCDTNRIMITPLINYSTQKKT